MKGWLTGIIFFISISAGYSQRQVDRSGAFWPELQAEYIFKNTSFLFLRNQYRRNFEEALNHLREKEPYKQLERIQFRWGYEHVFNGHWSGGASQAYGIERTRNILFNELYGRHSNQFGKFRISQRASYEHIMRWPGESTGRIRTRVEVDRIFAVKSITLRPRISYELFYNISYNQETQFTGRWIDRTRVRGEVQLTTNPHWAFVPFFIRQTDYFNVEPAFNANNEIVRQGGHQNHIFPIYGLDIRYAFFQGGKPFSRIIQSAE